MLLLLLYPILLFICSTSTLAYYNPDAPPGDRRAVLLTNVKSLTLRANRDTSHRRLPAIPQLKCTGPKRICNMYAIDLMRCTNDGTDYDENEVQWTCSTNLPDEFHLGSTDVICEGFRSSDDPWILKGSCGVEYKLLLSGKTREAYGYRQEGLEAWKIILILFGFFVFVYFITRIGDGNANNIETNRRGGGGEPWDDPLPPYDYSPRGYFQKRTPFSNRPSSGPGFWTGAATGATAAGSAGYMAGRARERTRSMAENPWGVRNSVMDSKFSLSRESSFPRFEDGRESTGFGSTRRR